MSTPHPIDVYVGRRLRFARQATDSRSPVTQPQLAEAIGTTFQQVQKYERGQNRISASRLYLAAQFFKLPVGWFFEGLESG